MSQAISLKTFVLTILFGIVIGFVMTPFVEQSTLQSSSIENAHAAMNTYREKEGQTEETVAPEFIQEQTGFGSEGAYQFNIFNVLKNGFIPFVNTSVALSGDTLGFIILSVIGIAKGIIDFIIGAWFYLTVVKR